MRLFSMISGVVLVGAVSAIAGNYYPPESEGSGYVCSLSIARDHPEKCGGPIPQWVTEKYLGTYYPPESTNQGLAVEHGNLSVFKEPSCEPAARPLLKQTRVIKLKMLNDAGLNWKDAGKYELDHIVPLCLGGDPIAPSNLQLQPWAQAELKDDLEKQMCAAVRRKEVSCHAATEFFRNGTWKAAIGLQKLLP